MASPDDVLIKEVNDLLREVEKKIKKASSAQPVPQAPVLSASGKSPRVRKRSDIELTLDYLRRDLKGDFDGRIGNMGSRYFFTKKNELRLENGQTVRFPPLQDLLNYYRSCYPQQIDAHLVGRKVLEHILSDENVSGVKIAYGLLPGYEKTLTPVQNLIVKAIYRLQRLLREESREPRQIILSGIKPNGQEERHLPDTESTHLHQRDELGGVHGTDYSLPAGRTQAFPSAVPDISMGLEQEGYETLGACPPNGR